VADRRGKAGKDLNPLAKRIGVRVEERRIIIIRDEQAVQSAGSPYVAANKMAAPINIDLHQTGVPAHVRGQAVTVSRRGILRTVASLESDAKMVFRYVYKEAILKAVRAVDPEFETFRRMGNGGGSSWRASPWTSPPRREA